MTITAQEALQRTIEHREIFHDEMLHLMRHDHARRDVAVMSAAIITGLRVKKETIGEIAAAATVMREFANHVSVPDSENLVDIVGTGGDGSHTFNISTATMFVTPLPARRSRSTAIAGYRVSRAAPTCLKRWA
jgi:anthranilate phosphoribosyltransferase